MNNKFSKKDHWSFFFWENNLFCNTITICPHRSNTPLLFFFPLAKKRKKGKWKKKKKSIFGVRIVPLWNCVQLNSKHLSASEQTAVLNSNDADQHTVMSRFCASSLEMRDTPHVDKYFVAYFWLSTNPWDGCHLKLEPVTVKSRMLEAPRLVIKQIQWRTTTQWNNILDPKVYENIFGLMPTLPSWHIGIQQITKVPLCWLLPPPSLKYFLYIFIYSGFFLNTF